MDLKGREELKEKLDRVYDPAIARSEDDIAGPSLEKYGGRVIVGAGPFEVMEGSWAPHRVVVMEFDSVERAREWYASDEFAPALAIRLKAATTDLIIVDGV